MNTERNLRFLKILLENEPIFIPESPLRYGISKKAAKRILNTFSIKIINKPEVFRHYTQNTILYRIKVNYLSEKNILKTYILTIEIYPQKENGKFLKEYFYLKLIFHILFNGEYLTAKELITLIKLKQDN